MGDARALDGILRDERPRIAADVNIWGVDVDRGCKASCERHGNNDSTYSTDVGTHDTLRGRKDGGSVLFRGYRKSRNEDNSITGCALKKQRVSIWE